MYTIVDGTGQDIHIILIDLRVFFSSLLGRRAHVANERLSVNTGSRLESNKAFPVSNARGSCLKEKKFDSTIDKQTQ